MLAKLSSDLFNQANKFLRENDFEKAVKIYSNLFENGRRDSQICLYLGFAMLNLKNFEDAFYYLNEAEKLNNSNPDIYNFRGIVNFHLTKFELAFADFSKTIAITGKNAQNLNNLGLILTYLKKTDKAENYFDEAIIYDANFITAHLNLANVLLYKKDLRKGFTEQIWKSCLNQNDFNERLKNISNFSFDVKEIIIDCGTDFEDFLFYSRFLEEFKFHGIKPLLYSENKKMREIFNPQIGEWSDKGSTGRYLKQIEIRDLPIIFFDKIANYRSKSEYLKLNASNAEYFTNSILIVNKHERESTTKVLHDYLTNTYPEFAVSHHLADDFTQLFSELNKPCFKNSLLIITSVPEYAQLFAVLGKIVIYLHPSSEILWQMKEECGESIWYKNLYVVDIATISSLEEIMSIINKIKSERIIGFIEQIIEKNIRAKNFASAIEMLNYHSILYPENIYGYLKTAYCYQTIEDYENAACFYKKVLDIDPSNIPTYTNLGLLLRDSWQFDEAETLLKKVVEALPDNNLAINNLGLAFEANGKMLEAENMFLRAVTLCPNFDEAWLNLSSIYAYKKEYEKSIQIIDKLLQHQPDNPDFHFNKAVILLKTKKFSDGWEEHEWRKSKKNYNVKIQDNLPQGADINGKTIIVYDEQGFGDSIQFARYLKLLNDLGAIVDFYCYDELLNLMKYCNGVHKVESKNAANNKILNSHYRISLLSLPRYFKTEFNTIPSLQSYLNIPVEIIQENASFLKLKKMHNIGIVWKGRQPINNFYRSIPFEDIKMLLNNNNVQFFSLQKDGINIEETEFLITNEIFDLSQNLTNYLITASIIMQMDLIITIDTSVAHLAGALGKETWLLLPEKSDWRWFDEIENSPWYPSMKVYRQQKIYDWQELIEKVSDDLNFRFKKINNQSKIIMD